MFVDGSAFWPSNPDARRAGWSIVIVDDAGNLAGAIYGHLPWGESDEQTPGHGEMYALRRAAELSVGPLRVYTDYREAAEGVKKGRDATTGPRAKHAAHWRAYCVAVEDRDFEVTKVKGHITAAEVDDDEILKWRRRGNAIADKLAKRGARAHFTDEHWKAALEADKHQDELVQICTWIGSALSDWPQEKQVRRKPADRAAMQAKRRQRRAAARDAGGHRLDWSRDGWRCRYCGTESRTPSGARRVLDRPCPGHTAARLPRQGEYGLAAHILWTAQADATQRQRGPDITWCSVCGAYSSTKLYKLKGRCMGPATGAALTRLKALRRLRHPVSGYALCTPHRATDEFLDAVADRGAERRRLYDNAFSASTSGAPVAEEGRRLHSSPGSRDDGSEDGEVGVGVVSEPPLEMDDTKSVFNEEDVFGHGGALDETPPGDKGCCDSVLAAPLADNAEGTLGAQTGDGNGSSVVDGTVSYLTEADAGLHDASLPRRRISHKRPALGTPYGHIGVKRRKRDERDGYDDGCYVSADWDPAPRMVLYRPIAGAGGESVRTVPVGHVASRRVGVESDDATDNYHPHPALRAVPLGHAAGTVENGLRAVLRHAATRPIVGDFDECAVAYKEGGAFEVTEAVGVPAAVVDHYKPLLRAAVDIVDQPSGRPGSSTDGAPSTGTQEAIFRAGADGAGTAVASPTAHWHDGRARPGEKRAEFSDATESAARRTMAARRIAAVRERVLARCSIAKEEPANRDDAAGQDGKRRRSESWEPVLREERQAVVCSGVGGTVRRRMRSKGPPASQTTTRRGSTSACSASVENADGANSDDIFATSLPE